jgi:hypothetical protein
MHLLLSDSSKGKTELTKEGDGESASKVEGSFYLPIKGNLYFSTKEILLYPDPLVTCSAAFLQLGCR